MFIIFIVLIGVCSTQYLAWPASSYNPYYARYYSAAATPIATAPVVGTSLAAAYPVPVAAAPVASAYPTYAPLPPAAPLLAPPVASAPIATAHTMTAAVASGTPMLAAAPTSVVAAPSIVPAYAPFQTAAYFIGSNKAKETKA
uniref:Cuticle protein 16.5-like n=1 Tax=Heterorhabditis bacteriophora TaxID=37862 RepID=A0A1I7XNZ3_HETBA